MPTLPPLALYLHLPWCIRKCPYCDFNSHAQNQPLPEAEYLDALSRDLAQELARLTQKRPLHSIFIGGGTPSLFHPDSLAALLNEVDRLWGIPSHTEITLEANPGTFEMERFQGFRQAGINRLSIGVQSFHTPALQALGRIHNAQQALAAAQSARELFPRVNLDLMHGLPGQTPEQALADLQQAVDLEPDHLSWYQLTIEPNTEFHARPPQLPVDEALWSIQESGQQLLAEQGFVQYEISAYARAERYSQHNLNYWRFGDYLGIGAGAHGKVSRLVEGQLEIERHHKLRQPKAYMQALNPDAGRERVAPEDQAFEFMLNALRLTSGVESSLLHERTVLNSESLTKTLQQARQRGLLEADPGRLQPSAQGRLFLNDLLELFL
ncbi:radical SAM family heme chaperone HemW [Nitrincola tapanii]|uniref:Heme chaperone HemW n=1 Tax=Nitrincola tapanii TaxID=1708751 RepID=A0A5A9W1I7_9GAMM|nr:radical SAM family heme chaperone HemW [Nitrincola tapanii]KAA0874344.1 radical SAM family heme chaperone HemW [Nitrincola tapanii]